MSQSTLTTRTSPSAVSDRLAEAAEALSAFAREPQARHSELAEIMTNPVVVEAVIDCLRCESSYVLTSVADASLSTEEVAIADVVLGARSASSAA